MNLFDATSLDILVGGFIVHDELAPRKEETIRLGFIGVIDHLPLLLSSQLGELVDVLPSVCASGDASRESELKLR